MTSDRECFADSQWVRTAAKQLLHQLGDDADHPVCILTGLRFRYQMKKGDGPGADRD